MSQMLYQSGNEFVWEKLNLRAIIVDESEIESKLAEGWYLSPFDTVAPVVDPAPVVSAPVVDSKPTREEMEQKAKELGLKFDGRTSDSKLISLIEEALK